MASLSISFMILNKIVGTIGQTSMNAWTLAGRMDQMVLIPSFAVSGATIPICAQNYGRGLLDRVRNAYKRNIVVGLCMVGCAAIAYNILAPWLFRAFSDVPEVISAAVRQVRIVSWSFLGVSAAIISSAAFQATGRPLPALALTVLRVGVISIPLALLLVFRFNMGMLGVWVGLATGNSIMLPLAFSAAWLHLKKLQFKPTV
jgi:Na+-driven multidrug efflux pump